MKFTSRLGKPEEKISLMELSTINANDLQLLAGKKMNFAEKVLFKISQRRLRSSIAPDGTIDNKRLEKLFKKKDGETGFHAGGFFLGLFLWIIGVLIAYLINDEKKATALNGHGSVLRLFCPVAYICSCGIRINPQINNQIIL
jgi:hypothetical protein